MLKTVGRLNFVVYSDWFGLWVEHRFKQFEWKSYLEINCYVMLCLDISLKMVISQKKSTVLHLKWKAIKNSIFFVLVLLFGNYINLHKNIWAPLNVEMPMYIDRLLNHVIFGCGWRECLCVCVRFAVGKLLFKLATIQNDNVLQTFIEIKKRNKLDITSISARVLKRCRHYHNYCSLIQIKAIQIFAPYHGSSSE